MMRVRTLGQTGLSVSRLGLGLAAVGRPGYINLGRTADLPPGRDVEAMCTHAGSLLDAARAAGIRYVDVARSYGRAEEFLARWLAGRGVDRPDLTVGSKWGYAYTAGWQVDAVVHEQKELSLDRFTQQIGESRALLGPWLDLYQIHSATAESGCLADEALLRALVIGRRDGWYRAVGLTLSGATSDRTLDQALGARVDGESVFDVVQATFNILEPSLGPFLAAAHETGMGVIVKEVHANGRLTPANARPEDRALRERLQAIADAERLSLDQLAIAVVTACPWVDCVLSGAATPTQLASHAGAVEHAVSVSARDALRDCAETPQHYWATRASLAWN